ncbi:MAG: 5'-nucleotidase, lipoprotein e(P4) family [Reyranella sp.]|uniref:5'-nucleotidase, lipoprotein e(P4) family n=1 Tax=Reyranella sp. TaxID=1929291 RepID=UPI003D0F05A5
MIARKYLVLGSVLAALSTGMAAGGAVRAQEVAPNDLLLATLWTQRSVEYRANALTVFALAKIRLDEALADKSWTAAPAEQKDDFQNLPPAIVLDVDETVLDNSLYQAWMMKNNQTFSTKTWNVFCATQVSRAIPGALEFTKYADSKGVKVFYITNRDASTEKDTRENMAKLGFPMGGNVDTFMMQNEQQGWGSAKGTRRTVVAKDYRVLLNIGDNFGDFDDRYRTSEADRAKAFDSDLAYWGRQWLMIPNPTYGSFDTATYGHDFKKPQAEQRKAKWDTLETWVGPKQ